ncbi:MAG: hypothetical protein HYR96_13920 [Deltaproteobacteria bacterium]|nr:hypothetical protein [Deltaproteobacteria bacterium]MBI3293891.1 hypothetical protein [Deltaproteobacteria bacterium]
MTQKSAWWVAGVFLLLCTILDQWGDTNTRSRLALLNSIREDQSFSIDHYKEWTIDWARTPDGRYYSNKAPGPVFLALPLFFLIDSLVIPSGTERSQRDRLRAVYSERVSQALSLILQVIPFLLVFCWAGRLLRASAVSPSGEAFFAIAFLLGSTVTIFLNTFFGHGLAAVFATALLLSLLDRRWFLAGTFFGWGLLSDYGSGLFLFGALILVWAQPAKERWRAILKFLLGGVVPGTLWVYYHASSFGGVLSLPNRFQNPDFVETGRVAEGWGIFQAYPDPAALFQLLFGPIRGILFTQPWLLIVLALIPAFLKTSGGQGAGRKIALFSGLGFLLLLLMNASFINWHAGGSPGPRYLCAIFPNLAILGAFCWDRWPRARRPLIIGLALTLLFNSLVFGSHRIQNPENVWVWLYFASQVFTTSARMPLIRWGIFLVLTGVILIRAYGVVGDKSVLRQK